MDATSFDLKIRNSKFEIRIYVSVSSGIFYSWYGSEVEALVRGAIKNLKLRSPDP